MLFIVQFLIVQCFRYIRRVGSDWRPLYRGLHNIVQSHELVLLQSPRLSRPAVVDDSWFEEAGGLQQNQQHQLFFSLIKFTNKKILQGKLTFSSSPLLHLRCKSHPRAAPSTWKCHPIHPVSKEQNKSVTYIQKKHVCFIKGMSSTSSRFMQQCNILKKKSWCC
jgi:hypothetical protein